MWLIAITLGLLIILLRLVCLLGLIAIALGLLIVLLRLIAIVLGLIGIPL